MADEEAGDTERMEVSTELPQTPQLLASLIFEGIRGPGIEGDIAIDDVSVAEGECAKQDLPTKNSVDGAVGILVRIWLLPVIVLISILSPR